MRTQLRFELTRAIKLLDEDAEHEGLDLLLGNGHIAGCRRSSELPCWWCESALVTPQLRAMVSEIDDVAAVTGWTERGFIWLVAAWTILEDRPPQDRSGMRDGALELLGLLESSFERRAARLRRQVMLEASPGGRLLDQCLRIASLRAAAFLVDHEEACAAFVDTTLKAALTRLRSMVDAERAQVLASVEIDRVISTSAPNLLTAPEIDKLASSRLCRERQMFKGVEKGSITELALHATMVDSIAAIHRCADLILDIPGTLELRRSGSRHSHPRIIRPRLWSRFDIDWVQTYFDLTGASCWKHGANEGNWLVPWFVDMAIESSGSCGQRAAIHQQADDGASKPEIGVLQTLS